MWERHDDPEYGEGIRYLHADRFAAKVKGQIQRLGVDYLFCTTNHWMRDDEYLNLYGWWSSQKVCRVLIFATQGLVLPTDGSVAGRVIANAVVQCLGRSETSLTIFCFSTPPASDRRK